MSARLEDSARAASGAKPYVRSIEGQNVVISDKIALSITITTDGKHNHANKPPQSPLMLSNIVVDEQYVTRSYLQASFSPYEQLALGLCNSTNSGKMQGHKGRVKEEIQRLGLRRLGL